MSQPASVLWKHALSALVVEPNEFHQRLIVLALTSADFRTCVTDDFHDARLALTTDPPIVLVADIRLGAYNGLQLAFRARSMRPHMAIIVTSAIPDPVLQRDAESAGATFVLTPLTEAEFLAAVYRTALQIHQTDEAVLPIRPPFERRSGKQRRAIQASSVLDRRAGDRRRDPSAQLRAVASLDDDDRTSRR